MSGRPADDLPRAPISDHRTPGSKSAVVIGSTGLVGRECVTQLLARPEFGRVTAVARRAVPSAQGDARLRIAVVDFDRLRDHSEIFRASHVFCALGTTLKLAGSRERFRHVDFGYSLRAAEGAAAAGAPHFLLVSSAGASPTSGAFYLQVKGDLEEAILALRFPSFTIVRPAFLVGGRSEFRLGEQVAIRLSWAFPRAYRAVQVRDVVRALVNAAVEDRPGARVIENSEIAGRGERRAVAPDPSGHS